MIFKSRANKPIISLVRALHFHEIKKVSKIQKSTNKQRSINQFRWCRYVRNIVYFIQSSRELIIQIIRNSESSTQSKKNVVKIDFFIDDLTKVNDIYQKVCIKLIKPFKDLLIHMNVILSSVFKSISTATATADTPLSIPLPVLTIKYGKMVVVSRKHQRLAGSGK